MKPVVPKIYRDTDVLNKVCMLGYDIKKEDLNGTEVIKVADIYDFSYVNLNYTFMRDSYSSSYSVSRFLNNSGISDEKIRELRMYTFENCNIGQLFYSLKLKKLFITPFLLKTDTPGFTSNEDLSLKIRGDFNFILRYFYCAGLVFYKDGENPLEYALVSYKNNNVINTANISSENTLKAPTYLYAMCGKTEEDVINGSLFMLINSPKSVICLDSKLNLYDFPKDVYKSLSEDYFTSKRYMGTKG